MSNCYRVALAALKQVGAANVLDLSVDELAFFTSDRLWLASDRRLAESCMKSAAAGALDVIGLPRFAVPAEFVAAVIAHYVHPVNTHVACAIMDGVETTGNIVAGLDRPLSARELFAMVLQIRAGETDRLDGMVAKAKRRLPNVDAVGTTGGE